MAKRKRRDWTNNEVELLLKIAREYKVAKAAENIDWESVKSKYGDILERYLEHYPSPEEAMAMGKEYPHKKDEITKGQLTTKLKAIRLKYRKAVNLSRKCGHGEVVFLHSELCESIWGGPPATCGISRGIEMGDTAMEVLEAVESTASSPDAGTSSVPGGDAVAEDAVSAEVVGDRPQRLNTSCRKSYRGTTAMVKSTTRDLFAWTDDEVELLLKVTLEYKAIKAAENIDWESVHGKYSDILELYLEHYPSSEEAMAMGKDYPHRKDDILKGQLTPKLKSIRFKYRKAVDSGTKRGHGRVVLLYSELCESIWGGSLVTCAISEGIETGDATMEVLEAMESTANSPDIGSLSVPGGEGVAEDAVSAEVEGDRPQRLDTSSRKSYGGTTAMVKSATRDFFAWTNDEVELLLRVTHEYKAIKAAENIDWELEQSKYSDILERYLEHYPSPEEAMAMGKEYPHKKDEITKDQVTPKLKAIRFKYRKAVNSGRKRGHGRVVLLYSEVCESIWGGPPATSKGIETGEAAMEMAKSTTRDFFAWTDDEVELLLKVTHEYKTVKAAENIDWELEQSKYSDILERYLEHYPSPEEAMAMGKEYPHKKDEITKDQLTPKLKAIRFKYRKAVNSGRKRGHGRVVLLYSEVCESIWGGPPATSKGIETGEAAMEMAKSTTRDFFAWTDDEVELLLKVTHEYKTVKAAENIDWELEQSKYSDILERYLEHYPSPEEAMAMGKEYPHKKDEITKGHLTTKLKAIRFKYRKAVDSGRKHGHGRVVLLYSELCESIWGGRPATRAISEGIEMGDAAMEVLEAVESTASSPDAGTSSVPGGDGVAEDAVSAEVVGDRPQRLNASSRISYRGTTAMVKSTTRDFFAWTNAEVELLLKVTHEYKTVKAAENIDWELEQSKYSDILERYLENYPSPEEAMAMGKEYPHKKDEITKDQVTPKLKAIRFKYRKAVNSGRKRGHGRVVLLYSEVCESIWGGPPATSKGIETGEAAMEMAKSTTRDFFAWTDDEVELLLKVTHEYKTVKAAENIDWELEQSKYSDILERYLEHYPSPEEAMAMGKEYPHKKDEITKDQLTPKLKAIRFKYRKAVNSGRKRGHGRVVLLYSEVCESIWGGPPATSKGIETGEAAMEMAKSTTRDFFAWTDDEVELLLKVTHEYKTVKAAENIDWELEQGKYSDILERYLEHYPSPEEAMAMGKEYPHKKDEITKGHLTTKLKAIRFKYRKAVDSGRKHGHGRVVLLYSELCESIWGGRPATRAISEGIEMGDAAIEVLEAVESTASSPDAETSSVPGGDGVAEDAVSAEVVGDRPQRLNASSRISYRGTTAMVKSTTRDFFAWTNAEVELLLKVTHEYKTVKAAENIDWELEQSKYSDILERYLENYPSPEEAMAMGKEYPHKKDEITKVQLTPKLKAIRFKYRKAVDSGRKRGHGRVVLLYSELCESIWGERPSTRAISEGIETADTEMAKSTTRDFFAWTDDEVELLLKVTHEYKTVKAVENIDWESVHSKYADILQRYLEHYPSPEEAMAMGKEYPHKKDEITKGQLTTKLKAIRKKYRQAVGAGPGKKRGRGRAVLLYFELCESIWTTTRAISDMISAGIETGDVAVEAVESIASLPDAGSTSVPGGYGAAEGAVSAETVVNRRQTPDANLREKYRREKLKRKLPTDPVAQDDLAIKRRLLQRLEAADNEFVQTLGRWTSTLDRLNSNIELLVQHIVGSGTTQQNACSYGHTPTGRPPQENHLLAHDVTLGAEGVTPPSPPNSVEGENPVTSTEPTLSELMEEFGLEASSNTESSEQRGDMDEFGPV